MALHRLVLVVATLIIVAIWLRNRSQQRKRYPPGPRGWPVIGNYFEVARLQGDHDEDLLELAQKWGGMCMMWMGSKPILFVNSRQVAKDLLDERSAIYSSRPDRNVFRKTVWPFRLMAEPAGTEYRHIRKLYNNYLSAQQSLLFLPYQDFESRTLVHTLLDTPAAFMSAVEKYTVSVTFSVVHGCRLNTLEHPILVEFMDLWDNVMKYIVPGTLIIDYLPFLQRIPYYVQPRLRKILRLVKREMKLHLAFLRNLQSRVKADSAPDCFGADLARVQSEQNVDDEKATHILSMLIGAGSDSTASALQNSFKFLALNPDAVNKAQADLDRVVGPNRLPTWGDEASLPNVRSLIKEIHRCGPLGSVGIPHCAVQDDIYHGYLIPRGTIIFPNIWAMSNDPTRYEKPEMFNPTRFSGDDHSAFASAHLPNVDERDHYHYGFGRRFCPGIHVAEASLFINLSRILWGFDVKPKPGHPVLLKDRFRSIIWKPKQYEVDITCRGPEYEKTIRRALHDAETDALDFDDVMDYIPSK